jgi:hypothetical protein
VKELGSKAQALLEAAQRQQSPAADVRARVWEQTQARAAAGDLGPTLPEASGATPVATTKILSWVVAAAVGGGAVAALLVDDDDAPVSVPVDVVAPSQPQPEPVATPDPQPAAVVVPEVEADAPAPVAEAPASAQPVNPTPRKASRGATAAAAKPAARSASDDGADDQSDLAEEVRLMRNARGALGSGDAQQALGLLREHARRFPRGVLAKERDVSMITALCALGQTKAARVRADAFLKKHPRSPLAERVRRSCVAG